MKVLASIRSVKVEKENVKMCRKYTTKTAYPTRVANPMSEPIQRSHPTVWTTSESSFNQPKDQLDELLMLNEGQLSSFEKNGFIFLPSVFSKVETNALLRKFKSASKEIQEKAVDPMNNPLSFVDGLPVAFEPGTEKIRSIFGYHKMEMFSNVVNDPRIVRPVQQILGDELELFQARINSQPPHTGNGFEWHSDFETWHSEDGMPIPRAVTAVVFLTDNLPQTGPTFVIPSSHKRYYQTFGPTPKEFWKKSLTVSRGELLPGQYDEKVITKEADEHGIVYGQGAAGGVFLFDCNILHGSHSNRSPWSRVNLFSVFRAKSNVLEPAFYSESPQRPEHLAYREPHPITPDYSLVKSGYIKN